MSPLLAALPLATEHGYRLMPVSPTDHAPLIKGGCHSASPDPDVIRGWASAWPWANAAIAMGDGVFALDIDRHGDVDGEATLSDLERTYGSLPATVTSGTPRQGRHLLFRTERHLRNKVGFRPGLDCRSKGGSICCPPSRRANGAYTWLRSPDDIAVAPAPAWLLALIDPPAPARCPAPPIRISGAERLVRYVTRAVEEEASAVADTPPNTGRNQRLFMAAARLGELVGAGVLPQGVVEGALEQAAHDCGLAHDDGLHSVRASIRSGLNRGIARPREVRA